MKQNFLGIGILVVFALLLGGALLLNEWYLKNKPRQYDAFVQCLSESGLLFYGAWWCPACQSQKSFFKGSLTSEAPYIECSSPGVRTLDNPVCTEENISSTPTWTIPGTPVRFNTLSRESLSLLSNCPLDLAGEVNVEDRTGEETLLSVLDQIGSREVLSSEENIQALRDDLEETGIDLSGKTGVEVVREFTIPIAGSIPESASESVQHSTQDNT